MLHTIDSAAGIWEAGSEMVFPGGFRLPVRMTVLRLPGGGLLLHSPVAIDDALADELSALGPVTDLVAPNLFHHVFLRPAQARWPEARVWGPPGLAEKRPGVRFSGVLATGAPPEWGGAVEVLALAGAPRFSETLLWHRPSTTLLCADLVFNMRRWSGFSTGLALAIFGTRGKLAASRVLHLAVRDKAAARESLRELQRWDCRRVTMGHGDVYESETARDDVLAALERRLGPGLRTP